MYSSLEKWLYWISTHCREIHNYASLYRQENENYNRIIIKVFNSYILDSRFSWKNSFGKMWSSLSSSPRSSDVKLVRKLPISDGSLPVILLFPAIANILNFDNKPIVVGIAKRCFFKKNKTKQQQQKNSTAIQRVIIKNQFFEIRETFYAVEWAFRRAESNDERS